MNQSILIYYNGKKFLKNFVKMLDNLKIICYNVVVKIKQANIYNII